MATEPQQPPDDEENERDRRTANLFLLGAAIVVVVGGIWLVNAMVDARKSEECFESGRRNCNPVDIPGSQPELGRPSQRTIPASMGANFTATIRTVTAIKP